MESERGFALQTMTGGSKRFTQGQLTHLNDDLKMLKEHTAEPKAPFAAVLRCADSRAHVELVFDQTIGHFSSAVCAGNIATADLIASLERYRPVGIGSPALI